MNQNKKIELLKKLQKLSKQGVGGEKVNAEKMLKGLMKKYNISEIELNSEEMQEFDYSWKNKFEKELFEWICINVAGDYHSRYRYIHKKNKGIVECSKADYIEIQAKFAFYKQKLNEELSIFVSAFAVKNNLHQSPDNKRKEKTDEVENEESREEIQERIKRVSKIMRLASALDKHDYLKQIGGGNFD